MLAVNLPRKWDIIGIFYVLFFLGEAEKKQQMQELVNEGLKEMDKSDETPAE